MKAPAAATSLSTAKSSTSSHKSARSNAKTPQLTIVLRASSSAALREISRAARLPVEANPSASNGSGVRPLIVRDRRSQRFGGIAFVRPLRPAPKTWCQEQHGQLQKQQLRVDIAVD